jgi:hypothetical protein
LISIKTTGGKFPVSAKKIAKKKAKPAAKKRAKPVPKEMAGPGRKERLPRKEEVRGYTPGLPDLQKWPDIAIELKVRPFYRGERLRAIQSYASAPVSPFYRRPSSDEQ